MGINEMGLKNSAKNLIVFQMMLIGFLAIYATPVMMGRLIFTNSIISVTLGLLGVFIYLVLLIKERYILSMTSIYFGHISSINIKKILLLGLLLRILWVLFFHPEPISDGAIYLKLANEMASWRNYEIANTRAYWPPGYPLILTPFVLIFGKEVFSFIILNFILYFLGILGTWNLTKSIGGTSAGNISAFLFAIWPNLVACTGTASKELVVVGLLPWAIFFLYKSTLKNSFKSGILTGICVLVQPSIMFWPLVCFAILFFTSSISKALQGAVFFIIGMIIIISPWTIRNLIVLDTFLPISSNGGYNLYRANNPLATGGYTERGEIDLSHLDELERDSQARRLALQWIKSNPEDFILLAFEKMVRFMGDDATGAYYSVKKHGENINKNYVYIISKLFLNIFWIFYWMILLIGIYSIKRRVNKNYLQWTPIAICFLYFFAIHSVFESCGKYHISGIWTLCVILSLIYSKEEN